MKFFTWPLLIMFSAFWLSACTLMTTPGTPSSSNPSGTGTASGTDAVNSDDNGVYLNGNGYFLLINKGETYYTRDGRMMIGDDGVLRQYGSGIAFANIDPNTSKPDGLITVPDGYEIKDISVAADGSVMAASKKIGELPVETFENPLGLQKTSWDYVYTITGDSGSATKSSFGSVTDCTGILELGTESFSKHLLDPTETCGQSGNLIIGFSEDLYMEFDNGDGSSVYTKGSTLHRNSKGVLVNKDGKTLLPQVGLPWPLCPIRLDADGKLYNIQNGFDQEVGTIDAVAFDISPAQVPGTQYYDTSNGAVPSQMSLGIIPGNLLLCGRVRSKI